MGQALQLRAAARPAALSTQLQPFNMHAKQQLPQSHMRCKHAITPQWVRPFTRHVPFRHRVCARADLDDTNLALTDLKQQLDAALAVEDYQLAARIRDAMQLRSVDCRLAVEDANTRFYDAFRNGSFKEMEAVWGEGDHVCVLHPGTECIAGRDEVLDSWRKILVNIRPRAFRIDLEDVRIWANDTTGYVTCVEVVDADDSMGRVIATNVFEKQNGQWKLVLHQGGPAPPRRRLRGL